MKGRSLAAGSDEHEIEKAGDQITGGTIRFLIPDPKACRDSPIGSLKLAGAGRCGQIPAPIVGK